MFCERAYLVYTSEITSIKYRNSSLCASEIEFHARASFFTVPDLGTPSGKIDLYLVFFPVDLPER